MLAAVSIFFGARCMRRRRERQRDEERAVHTALFGVISAPNGLEVGQRGTPPSYYETLKAQNAIGSFGPAPSSTPGHRREKSNSVLMDECWKAVYAAEARQQPAGSRNSMGDSSDVMQAPRHRMAMDAPASPRGVAHGDMRQSVSRWFRNQKWSPSQPNGVGPLCGNPANPEGIKDLPVPPSPSYTGVPRTPSAAGSLPPTPSTAAFLLPGASPFHEPYSARSGASWMTGDDRLSIRASIPASVLYPSPLQPAPPPRRRGRNEARRESVPSQGAYGSLTRASVTPPEYEGPPRYEARRTDSDSLLSLYQ